MRGVIRPFLEEETAQLFANNRLHFLNKKTVLSYFPDSVTVHFSCLSDLSVATDLHRLVVVPRVLQMHHLAKAELSPFEAGT